MVKAAKKMGRYDHPRAPGNPRKSVPTVASRIKRGQAKSSYDERLDAVDVYNNTQIKEDKARGVKSYQRPK